MNALENIVTTAAQPAQDPKKLLAAPRHTLILFGIVMFLLVAGAMNRSHPAAPSQVADSSSMIINDLIMIGMLWFWVLFVYRGMREHGHSIREFFQSKRLSTLKDMAGDGASAALALVLIYASSIVVHHVLPDHSAQSNPLLSSTPEGLLGIAAWIGVSISAGICEEIVFRGYLQRQLKLMTGNVGIAVVAQAVLFGIGHSYEGASSVMAIMVHGLFLGMLAEWRGNIRAGIIEHAGWDILAGFGLLSANW